jgi:ABC-type bacteriocin/lantibiotic exporter with double-glycine peptidase domain
MTQTRSLSAVDVLYPGVDEVIEVLEGQVLVFAQDPAGRRVPIGVVAGGGVVVGCAPTSDGTRLLTTGLAGTRVRLDGVSVDADGSPGERVLAWLRQISDAVSSGRWPRRVVPASRAGSMLSPGEHVVGESDSGTTWVRVTRGSATLCGEDAAVVGPGDPALPLERGGWLTVGLRTRIEVAPAPADPSAWAASLDLVSRLAMSALVARRQREDSAIAGRLEVRSIQADAAAQEAVDVVTAAIGGRERVPVLTDDRSSALLAAVTRVARANGLVVDDIALSGVISEVESGRDPVEAVAAACGARPRPIGLDPSWWTREGSPALVHVVPEQGGARVPMAAEWRRGWVLVDPLTAAETRVDASVATRVDREAVELLRVLPSTPVAVTDLLRLALRGSRREMAIIVVVTAMLTAVSFVTPYLMGQLANLFVSSASTSAYAGLFGALLLVVVAGTMWQAVRALSLLRARARAVAVAAGAVWERIMRQKATWHNEQSLGVRATQANAVNNASAALPDETLARLLDTATVVGSLAAIATTNGMLLVSLALLLALQLAITFGLLRSVSARAEARVAASALATGRLMEILRAVNRLRVAGAESRAFLRWAQVQAPFSRADQQLRRVTMAQGVVTAVWPVLALLVIVAVTAATGASFGEFVTAQTAATASIGAVAAMAMSANGALVARQSLRRVAPALESVPEGGADGVQPGLLSGGLEVRDLVFRYAPDLPPALDRVSLSVRPGEHVAIVGPSGCGKTTLMRILLGLEDPESGVIAVDGRDMASLNRPAVRRQIGCVLQSSTLLPCSIKDNIDLGRSMTRDEVWAALELAAVADDIRAMAMGLDTPVTDGGGTLSGGQRQRVLIARALAGNPRMLVLDEATSALDNLTQAAVVEALQSLRITRIVVAHRLSTIRHADRIIVMDAGRVLDEGTYDELMSRPGAFRDLAERQQA